MHATAGWLKASLNPRHFFPRLFWELLRKPRCSQHNCHWETQNGLKQPQLGASKKTSKLHRSKQPQQFLRLNSTCSQIGTSCSSAVSSNSHCCHSAAVAALPFLLLLATNFVLFCLFFFLLLLFRLSSRKRRQASWRT